MNSIICRKSERLVCARFCRMAQKGNRVYEPKTAPMMQIVHELTQLRTFIGTKGQLVKICRNFILSESGSLQVINDGVTIARSIRLLEAIENGGCN
ncbi:rubisco large subunit-binding protein subunit alpha [Quercus suber]|uniref:Rubisco large subunit-binding protein subunit alpha n=1 Tax=Quercus suber TaxID=58331 RepID=A0AAW0J642_QUESU